ncbi:MAG: hypothetical protein MI802_26840, partial [Desulfobacterales bacterium]|nr:hypothetical protein [Desulfobacterales bacterium]
MLFFDIDNTLLDHDNAESSAALAIYAQNRSLRDLYSEEEFPNIWKENAGGVYKEHTDGKLSFEQRQREGVKAIFKNTPGESEIDAILNDYLAVYEENWQLYYDVLPMLAKYK